ncbi:MAG: hypothetical protein OEY61_04700 [Gammaproteobacteria bacterium]|nr:hypothetical protein [Gammaproteobacteria bacterium]
MKHKQTSQLILFALLISASAVSFAGRQGVSFFYGIGLGAAYIDESAPALEFDAAASGEFTVGLEEDGWAVEYSGYQTIETGTSLSTLDYKLKGSSASLSYRTVESGGNYYKIKYGNADTDVSWSNGATTTKVNGNVYGLAMGFRLEKEKRMEIEYDFFSADSASGFADTHMVTLRYLFGGTPGRTGL